MNLPNKHKQILEEIIKSVITKPNRPPTLIKGERGTGKSWLISNIIKSLKKDFKNTNVWPVYIPLHLSAYKLVENIETQINIEKSVIFQNIKIMSNEKIKYRLIIILENLDVLFGLSSTSGNFMRPKKIGRGSTQYSQIQHANELRRYLIENSSKISILATASDNTSFIEDPEQPFYEFFNIIELNSLDNSQSLNYLKDSVKSVIPDRELESIINFFSGFHPKWLLSLTDGRVSLLNCFIDTLFQMFQNVPSQKNKELNLEKAIENYFIKASSILYSEIVKLTYSEKILIDKIVYLGNSFSGAQISIKELNSSLVLQLLCRKKTLEREGSGKNSTYRLKSMALKSWLRFSKGFNLYEIIDPTKSSKSVVSF